MAFLLPDLPYPHGALAALGMSKDLSNSLNKLVNLEVIAARL